MYRQPKRHPLNPNLKITYDNEYRGLPLKTRSDFSYITSYLDRSMHVLDKALDHYSKVLLIRFDLRFPAELDWIDSKEASDCLGQFFDSLNSQIKHQLRYKPNKTKIRYVGVKEYGDKSDRPHFHIELILNGHAYQGLGEWELESDNLYSKINKAWARALCKRPDDIRGLVHFPVGAVLHIERHNKKDYERAFERLRYLCKVKTKEYHGAHNFFSSRG